MDYKVEEIDIRDAANLSQIRSLLSEAFGADVPDGKLELSTTTNSPKPSLYVAAIQDDEIIGFNAFISHDMVTDGQPINCYQSCWTATSQAHRGKKIFQNLINSAKEILRSRDAAFIFGFPNPNSQPIFTRKLDFREIGSLKWQVPNIPGLRNLYVAQASPDELQKGSILQNDQQLIDLKTRTYGDKLVVVKHRNSVIWGIPREGTKAGIKLGYLEIGGVEIDSIEDLKPMFAELLQSVRGVKYFQLTLSADNKYANCFKHLKPAQTNDLIVYDLDLKTEGLHFNFFGGVKDVF